MPAPANSNHELYSRKTGFIYIFNLIVGTGALALPAAFAKAGWALGLAIILLLAFISFMTATFVIESMSIANAIILKTRRAKIRTTYNSIRNSVEVGGSENNDNRQLINRARANRERDPLIPPEFGDQNEEIRRHNSTANTFEIVQRVEMGRMASMFLPKTGLYLFYVCLCIYLYGDLAIYITAVATSLRDITCTFNETAAQLNDNYSVLTNTSNDVYPDAPCWSEGTGVTRYDAYRLYTIFFILILGPFTFFNVQKTKYLQMFTTTMRWAAFLIMITLATIKIAQGEGLGHPTTADIRALPNFFGVCVYAFMCHHSLPSLVSPIENKRGIFSLFLFDYFLITAFYLLLAMTGIFAFDHIQDLYTLNFEPAKGSGTHEAIFKLIIQYFLSLFPVFTLSTNFPIIAITLRNNLKTLFNLREDEEEDDDDVEDDNIIVGVGQQYQGGGEGDNAQSYNNDSINNTGLNSTNSSSRRLLLRSTNSRTSSSSSASSCILKACSFVLFPLLAIAPPFTIALFVENVQLLVSVTGSYAGAGIQYIVPIVLVYQARARLNDSTMSMNPYTSPFRHQIWIWFVVIWSILCVIFVTLNYIIHPTNINSYSVSKAWPIFL